MNQKSRNIFAAILFLANISLSIAYWRMLQDKFPIHFDRIGWVDKYWYKNEAVAAFTVLQVFLIFSYFLSIYSVRNPLFWKSKLAPALSPASLQKIILRADHLLDWLFIWMMILILEFQYETLIVGLGSKEKWGSSIWIVLALLVAGVVWLSIKFVQELARPGKNSSPDQFPDQGN